MTLELSPPFPAGRCAALPTFPPSGPSVTWGHAVTTRGDVGDPSSAPALLGLCSPRGTCRVNAGARGLRWSPWSPPGPTPPGSAALPLPPTSARGASPVPRQRMSTFKCHLELGVSAGIYLPNTANRSQHRAVASGLWNDSWHQRGRDGAGSCPGVGYRDSGPLLGMERSSRDRPGSEGPAALEHTPAVHLADGQSGPCDGREGPVRLPPTPAHAGQGGTHRQPPPTPHPQHGTAPLTPCRLGGCSGGLSWDSQEGTSCGGVCGGAKGSHGGPPSHPHPSRPCSDPTILHAATGTTSITAAPGGWRSGDPGPHAPPTPEHPRAVPTLGAPRGHLAAGGEELQLLDAEVQPRRGGLPQDEAQRRHLLHVAQHLRGDSGRQAGGGRPGAAACAGRTWERRSEK